MRKNKNIVEKQSIKEVVVDDNQPQQKSSQDKIPSTNLSKEIGARKGPEPTRYGDWEKNGRCIDF